MPDVPRTLYAVIMPGSRTRYPPAWTSAVAAEANLLGEEQVVPYHHLPTSGAERNACIRAMALAEWREDYADHEQREPFDGDPNLYIPAAARAYDALLRHYNQETD